MQRENARLWEAEVRRRTNRADRMIKVLESRLQDARAALDSHGLAHPLSYYPLAGHAARLDATMAELELLDDLRKGGLAAIPDPASLEPCDPHCRGAADHPADTGTDTCAYCGRMVRYARTGDQERAQHVHSLPEGVAPHPALRAHAPECAVCGWQVRYIPVREPGGPLREMLAHIGGNPPGDLHEPVLELVQGVPYTVSCPECKRPVGVRCVTLDTHEPTNLVHKARWACAAAKERAEREAQEREQEDLAGQERELRS